MGPKKCCAVWSRVRRDCITYMLNRFAKTFALISECTRAGNQCSCIIVGNYSCTLHVKFLCKDLVKQNSTVVQCNAKSVFELHSTLTIRAQEERQICSFSVVTCTLITVHCSALHLSTIHCPKSMSQKHMFSVQYQKCTVYKL